MSLIELVIASVGVGVMICIIPLALYEFRNMLRTLRG
jgi:hypothetical protein